MNRPYDEKLNFHLQTGRRGRRPLQGENENFEIWRYVRTHCRDRMRPLLQSNRATRKKRLPSNTMIIFTSIHLPHKPNLLNQKFKKFFFLSERRSGGDGVPKAIGYLRAESKKRSEKTPNSHFLLFSSFPSQFHSQYQYHYHFHYQFHYQYHYHYRLFWVFKKTVRFLR